MIVQGAAEILGDHIGSGHRRGHDDPGRGMQVRFDERVDRLVPEQADREISKRLNGPLDETAPTEPPITVCELLSCRMGFGTS